MYICAWGDARASRHGKLSGHWGLELSQASNAKPPIVGLRFQIVADNNQFSELNQGRG